MPVAIGGFLIDLLITLAIRFGLPWVLINAPKLPWIGKYIGMVLTPEVIKVISDFLESLKEAHGAVRAVKQVVKAKKAGARKKAIEQIRLIRGQA